MFCSCGNKNKPKSEHAELLTNMERMEMLDRELQKFGLSSDNSAASTPLARSRSVSVYDETIVLYSAEERYRIVLGALQQSGFAN